MKITKKLMTLVLAAVLLLSLAAPAMAADSDFEIWEHDDNTMLVKYNGSGSNVVIPDGVIAIIGYAFNGCSGLKSVTIPVSIYIEMNAFNDCPDLKSITFSANVIHITSHAFNNCPNLTDIYFGGTQEQWAALEKDAIKEYGMPIFGEGVNPTVHYSSTGPDTPEAPSFSDVSANAWYAAAVKWAVEKNITTGTSPTTFSPETTCNTAQILTFLWRACGSPKTDAANSFTDVSAGAWYYDAAQWAKSERMISGSTLSPDTPCTRASTVKFIWQAMGKPSSGTAAAFTDVTAGADYAAAVAWAVENGVTSGTSPTTFSPADTCTRGQIVTFLNRAFAK